MTDQSGQRRGRSRGLNRVQIIGNLGRDPEMRFTQGGTPVTNFSVAVSRSWQSRDGELREETEWFRVVAWTRLAEIANEYLRRGSKVYVEGRLATRTWQDREGNDRTTTELVAQEMIMLGGREESAQRDDYDGQRGGYSGGQGAGRPAAQDDEISPDDLPF
ncbi:MAG: single-stranded DNA-binding protein [Chloroflexi bacterium]|nr:single-stranded DNA-binding protein [Chloroflexota bacterium]